MNQIVLLLKRGRGSLEGKLSSALRFFLLLAIFAITSVGNHAWATDYTITGRINNSASGINGLPTGKKYIDLTSDDTLILNGTNDAQLYLDASNLTVNCDLQISGNRSAEKTGIIRTQSTGSTINGKVTLTADSYIGSHTNATTYNITFAGQLTGTGALYYAAGQNSTIYLNNTSSTSLNNYTGDTVIGSVGYISGAPLVQLKASDQIPDATAASTCTGNLVMNAYSTTNYARLDLNGFNETVNGLSTGTVSGGTPSVYNASTDTQSVFTVGANDATATYAGAIGAGGTNLALVKIGSGTQTLSGANTYTGSTTVNAGQLTINNAGSLNGEFIVNGGTLQLVTAPGSNATIALAGGTLKQSSVGLTINNVVEAKANTSSVIDTNGVNMTLVGNLTGTGIITRNGGNIVFLSGDNSNFRGTWIASASNTYIQSITAGSSNASWQIESGATISAHGLATGTISLGELTGSGTLRNDSTGLVTFNVGGKNADAVFTGKITDNFYGKSATDQTAINKVGSGTWTLTGTKQYSGGTTVSSGRLNISGALDGNMTVDYDELLASNATDVVFSPGATGAQTVGTTAISGTAAFDTGTLLIEIDDTDNDLITANAFTFTDNSVISFLAVNGYELSDNTSDITFLTSTTALPEMDWNSLLDPTSARFWNITTNGNSLVASFSAGAVPEPASWLLLILGGAGLLGLRSWKKR